MLAYFFARFNDEATHLVRCEEHSSYDDIFEQILIDAGSAFLPESIERESSRTGGLSVGPAALSSRKTARSKDRSIPAARHISPALLLRVFGEHEGLLIIDEYDRVRDATTHTRLAETLKHFSDAASTSKIIVVGVAETLTDLVGEHQSLTRCLAQIKLERMSHDELQEVITAGEDRVGVSFHKDVRGRIVALADGFPFYVHLLCKHAAEEAGRILDEDPNARVVVAEPEYRKALKRAIKTGEATLRDAYQTAVITVRRKTEMYRYLLWAVAYSSSSEVQVQHIADNIEQLTGNRPKIESLSSYLGPLTKPEKKEILVRVRQGYYKFANPLMRAYIRLVMEERNIELEGQRTFPWMRSIEP